MTRPARVGYGALAALAGAALAVGAARHAAPAGPTLLPAAPSPSDTKAGFSIRYKQNVSPHRVNAAFVLPGDTLPVEIVAPAAGRAFALLTEAGPVPARGPGRWTWHAPTSTGVHQLRVLATEPADSMTLRVFVMVPATRVTGEHLNRYRIGRYPATPFRQLAAYRAPRAFVEVTPENQALLVSPHFALGQFASKQQGGYPKYLLLDERLLLKLEYLLDRVVEAGHPVGAFHIMSGYRTPFYNASIGNGRYSRHVYGAAADIFVDENPRDGRMDDLNRDGRVDLKDAGVLYDLVERQQADPRYRPFIGGLGKYAATAAHGPFVHVDIRGYKARW